MRSLCLALAVGLAYPAAALAEAPTIQHTAVKCIVAGKDPKLEAAFAPSPVVIVFHLTGRPGERVAFTFRSKG